MGRWHWNEMTKSLRYKHQFYPNHKIRTFFNFLGYLCFALLFYKKKAQLMWPARYFWFRTHFLFFENVSLSIANLILLADIRSGRNHGFGNCHWLDLANLNVAMLDIRHESSATPKSGLLHFPRFLKRRMPSFETKMSVRKITPREFAIVIAHSRGVIFLRTFRFWMRRQLIHLE